MSNVPTSWNVTTTNLPPEPTHMDPPKHAALLKTRTDGTRQFVMGQCDTIKSMFYRVYPEALTPEGRNYLGGESHLRAYLEKLPGGFPKPGDIVNLPAFDNYIGKFKPEHLKSVVDRMENEKPRCQDDRKKAEQGARESNGATRMAQSILPRSTIPPPAFDRQNRIGFAVVSRLRNDIPAPVRSRY